MTGGERSKKKIILLAGGLVAFLAAGLIIRKELSSQTATSEITPSITAVPTHNLEMTGSVTPTKDAEMPGTVIPTADPQITCTVPPVKEPELTCTGLPADTMTPYCTVTPEYTVIPADTMTPYCTVTPEYTVIPADTMTPYCTVTPEYTVIPTDTPAPTYTLPPEYTTIPSCTASPTATPYPSATPVPTGIPDTGPTPTAVVYEGAEVLDFGSHICRFDESSFTLACQGTYKIVEDADYYNADGSYAGTLSAGDTVYANASNYYYKNLTTYRNCNGTLQEFIPGCGKTVYRVVINDRNYYMAPACLYGSYMGSGEEAAADRDETESYCVADGLTNYYHTEVWYYDEAGNHLSERINDVNKDGTWYFVSVYEHLGITDNYMTHKIPWGEIWSRAYGDPAGFFETDTNTGHSYVWHDNTFFFMDMDFDGICEYEVTVEEWFRWKELN